MENRHLIVALIVGLVSLVAGILWLWLTREKPVLPDVVSVVQRFLPAVTPGSV